MIAAGVDCFTCLQAELPPQGEAASWPAEGVRLPDPEARSRWPNPFVGYKADADAIASQSPTPTTIRYLHCSIDDLSVPSSVESLLAVLDDMLAHYEGGGQAMQDQRSREM